MDSNTLCATIATQLDQVMRRSEKRLTQAELSRQSGVPQPSISRILKGEANVQVETLWALTEALGVTLNDLAYSSSASQETARVRKTRPSQAPAGPILSALQQSVLDAFNKLVSTRQISDKECIAMLSQWAERLDASESADDDK